jgi:multiple sugar transport system substrate-binding protein
MSPLPTADGAPGSGALGGYHLAVSAHAPPARRALAVALARAYGRNPARRSVYDDRRLREAAPAAAAMQPLLARARPRPVTPYYPMITDTLQAELSAVVSGLRSPEEALRRAQAFADRVMGVEAHRP